MDSARELDNRLTAVPLWQRIGLWPLWMATNALAGLAIWSVVVAAFVLLDVLRIGGPGLGLRWLLAAVADLLFVPWLALAEWLLIKHLLGLRVWRLAIATAIASVAGLGIGFGLVLVATPLVVIPSDWLRSPNPLTSLVPESVLYQASSAWPLAVIGAFMFGASFLIVGLIQWHALRSYTRKTWRLALRCLLAGVVMGMLVGHLPLEATLGSLFTCRDPITCLDSGCREYLCAGAARVVPIYAQIYFLYSVLGAAIYGLVSSGAMVEQLRQALEPDVDEGYQDSS